MSKFSIISLALISLSNVTSALSIYYDDFFQGAVIEYSFTYSLPEPLPSFGIYYDLLPIDPVYGDYPPARITNLETWTADFAIVDQERVLDPIYIDPSKTLVMEDDIQFLVNIVFDEPYFQAGLEITIGGVTYSDVWFDLGELWDWGSGTLDWEHNNHIYEPVNLSERIVTALLAGETIYISVVPVYSVSSIRYPWLGDYPIESISLNAFMIGHVSGVPNVPFTKDSYDFSVTNQEVAITGYTCGAAETTIPNEIDGVPVTSIGNSAFQFCENLAHLTIPDSVTSIGDYAFFHCTSLDTIVFGEGLLHIGDFSFADCVNLTNVYFPDTLISVGDLAFSDCLSLENVTFGNDLKAIGTLAFWGCSSLSSVTIGSSVSTIGNFAFLDATNLSKVYFLGEPPYYDSGIFPNSNPDLTVKYQEGSAGWGTVFCGRPTQPFTPFVGIRNSGDSVSFQFAGGTLQESEDLLNWTNVFPPPEPESLLLMTIKTGQKQFLRIKNSPTSERRDVVGFEFIPADDFLMGLPSGGIGSWAGDTQHAVSLSRTFYMKDTPVTYDEWKAVYDWSLLPENIGLGYALPTGGMGAKTSESTGSHPVTRVDWYDAILWCNAKSEMEGRTPVYYLDATHSTVYRSGEVDLLNSWVDWQADGYRLPTEAEWEYACRAGTTTSFFTGTITATGFAFCPNLDAAGWYGGNSGINTHPVGEKLPNPWGLYDVHGNIWEWTWDHHEEFTTASQIDPIGPDTGSNRIMRGGSHNNNAESCQSSARFPNPPANSGSYGGLRIAISVGD
ncbi:leucine-rich repeat protein [Puniceicoccales bacterium CK1056]|uniref:Leucine-rich repeat protein n=1 Tax=Oceanipulchritudo coccoides TaxID=2706888 RepID=A0A6B2LX09_9BACT|nr:leucine-rich repeat protein [Oceanipulchritudo coccoides]NDV61078.1 leucine-rich repeat protein [Oceanipulchritudo coccoides]